MEEQLNTLIGQCAPLLPEGVDRVDVCEVNAVLGVVILWWQGLRDIGHLLSQLPVACEQLEEDEPRARRRRSYSRFYSTKFGRATLGRRAR